MYIRYIKAFLRYFQLLSYVLFHQDIQLIGTAFASSPLIKCTRAFVSIDGDEKWNLEQRNFLLPLCFFSATPLIYFEINSLISFTRASSIFLRKWHQIFLVFSLRFYLFIWFFCFFSLCALLLIPFRCSVSDIASTQTQPFIAAERKISAVWRHTWRWWYEQRNICVMKLS